MIPLPEAPNVTDQRVDKSGFVSSQGSSAHATCSYALKGPLRPVQLNSPNDIDAIFGRPDPKVSMAHYCVRHLLKKGEPVYFRRVVNGARYGGVAVLADAANNTVTIDPYPATGSAFPADPDPSTGIAPTGPGYIALTFDAAFIADNAISLNVVMDSQVVAVGPVNYATNSDATMVALAAAIEAALAGAGSDGKATVIDADPSSTTNARTIGIFAPSGQQISLTNVTVTGGVSQATASQATPLFYVQAENPGAWSSSLGFKLTNADVGVKEVITMTFANSVGSVAALTVTINGVSCSIVEDVTPSDAFLQAVATAIAAHPDVDTATVVKKPLGESNDREISIRMLRGSTTDAVITHEVTGAAPTITYTQVVKGQTPSGAFDLEVYSADNPTVAIERHRVSIAQQVDKRGVQQQVSYVIGESENKSEQIRVITSAAVDGSVAIPFNPLTGAIMSSIRWLSAGTNGALPTSSMIAEAYKDFEDSALYPITTLISAGYTSVSVIQAIVDVAKKRNDGTHVIFDIPPEYQKYDALVQYRLQQLAIDTEYASAYYPDVQMEDPYTGMKLWVPNSGHIAAMYAKNDSVRGIGKAPAGLRVGQIDTTAVRYEYKDEMHNVLFKNRLNPIRREGGAFYVMGDATMQYADSAFSFVNVARLVGFLQGRIRQRARFYLFENNNDTNAFALVTDIEQFLEPWKTDGDLNEYRVVSKLGVNNTNGIIEQGNRILDVILDPSRSTRRILVRSTITRTGGVSSIEITEF